LTVQQPHLSPNQCIGVGASCQQDLQLRCATQQRGRTLQGLGANGCAQPLKTGYSRYEQDPTNALKAAPMRRALKGGPTTRSTGWPPQPRRSSSPLRAGRRWPRSQSPCCHRRPHPRRPPARLTARRRSCSGRPTSALRGERGRRPRRSAGSRQRRGPCGGGAGHGVRGRGLSRQCYGGSMAWCGQQQARWAR
jgi:hypothetical protein